MPITFRDRASLAWRILRAKADSNSLHHAERELLIAFPPDAPQNGEPKPFDGWNDAMRQQVLEVLLVFSIQGNSGSSAMCAIPTVERLMRQEPLTPLTGDPDEWTEVSEMSGVSVYQNKRCSHVFKDGEDGQAHTIEGYVFQEPQQVFEEGGEPYAPRFTGKGSARAISFPYWPTAPQTVKVDMEGNRLDGLPRLPIMPEEPVIRAA